MLLKLTKKWQREGRGILLGKFMGSREAFHKWSTQLLEHLWYYDPENIHVSALGFLDDIITLASSMNDTNIMFEDIWKELQGMCLSPQPKKLKVMANRYVQDVDAQVRMGEWEAEKVESLEILGSIIQANGVEYQAYQHRITQENLP